MRTTLTVLSALILCACGGGADGNAPEERVKVTGTITEQHAPILCDGVTPNPEVFGGPDFTVRDGAGTILATGEAGDVEARFEESPLGQTCFYEYDYSVDLPRSQFYQFELEGSAIQPEPVSYEELEADGFQLDLQYEGQ